jgi:hypothetical protein
MIQLIEKQPSPLPTCPSVIGSNERKAWLARAKEVANAACQRGVSWDEIGEWLGVPKLALSNWRNPTYQRHRSYDKKVATRPTTETHDSLMDRYFALCEQADREPNDDKRLQMRINAFELLNRAKFAPLTATVVEGADDDE